MQNKSSNTTYRNCVDDVQGNCPFMRLNKFATECCSIDSIVQVKYFGCIPQQVLDKKEKTENV